MGGDKPRRGGDIKVWTSGGDLSFAKECWSHLAAAGLTSDDSILDLTRTHLRLLALRLIYGEFCLAKWGDEFEAPISFLAEDLYINPLALGLIASGYLEHGEDFLSDEYELHKAALSTATDVLKPEVFSCLISAYEGDIGLFRRMSRTIGNFDNDDDASDGATVSGDLDALSFIRSRQEG